LYKIQKCSKLPANGYEMPKHTQISLHHQKITKKLLIMKTLHTSSKIALFVIMLQIAGSVNAQNHVFATFKGQVVVNSGDLTNVKALVTDEDGKSMTVFLSRQGKFKIHLPVGRDYRMVVEKAGYITKEVSIQLNEYSARVQKLNPVVEFDVVLYPQSKSLEMAYADAVGEIKFNPRTGKMMVEYNQRLIPSKRGFDQLITENK